MPTTHVWDKYQIKAEIGRRNETLTSLAKRYGLSAAALHMTLQRRKAITRADQAISDFLNVPLHVLWPDRYDDKGNRIVKLKPLSIPHLRNAAKRKKG